jgi:hypothetical protein
LKSLVLIARDALFASQNHPFASVVAAVQATIFSCQIPASLGRLRQSSPQADATASKIVDNAAAFTSMAQRLTNVPWKTATSLALV